jgi:phage head maturation protease
LEILPDRVVAVTRFASGVTFAEDLFRLYAQGVLRGWSIGFVPRQVERLPREADRDGLRIVAWDLLEYSAVPVPENPGALTVAMEKGLIRDPRLQRWLANDPLSELFER